MYFLFVFFIVMFYFWLQISVSLTCFLLWFNIFWIQESHIFEHLRVMLIEDMIYLVHRRGLAELVRSSLNSDAQLFFVDLEQDPPQVDSLLVLVSLTLLGIILQCAGIHIVFLFFWFHVVKSSFPFPPQMIREREDNVAAIQLVSVQKIFSLHFPIIEQNNESLTCNKTGMVSTDTSSVDDSTALGNPDRIDLSSCLQDTKISIPTLNG